MNLCRELCLAGKDIGRCNTWLVMVYMMLITERYRELNRQLHKAPRGFGASGHRWAYEIHLIVATFGVKTWLDYGSGQDTLVRTFKKKYPKMFKKIKYKNYDPCIFGKELCSGGKFDLVTCTDVLEHIEPGCLDDVIRHIYSIAKKAIFFNINIKEANKVLPDGRNAHLIIQGPEWWLERLGRHTDWRLEEKVTSRPEKDLNIWTYPISH